MDRNGLRPLRYTLTGDGLLIGGSETGMVRVDESKIIEKGQVGPGETIAVDLREGKLYHDGELRDRLAAMKPFTEWVKRVRRLDEIIAPEHDEAVPMEAEALRRRQRQYAWSMEERMGRANV